MEKRYDISDRIKDIEWGYNVNVETIPNQIESLRFAKQLLENVKKGNINNTCISVNFFSYGKQYWIWKFGKINTS